MFCFLLFLPLIFSFRTYYMTGISYTGEKYKDEIFIDVTTISVCKTLENWRLGNNGNGRKPYGLYLKTSYIRNVVAWTYEAAPLNPAFGDRKTTTIKLLAAFYGESGFHPTIKNTGLNKNGTFDVGLTQRNSIHAKPFRRFCLKRNLDTKKIRYEMLYAAYINQILKWNYKYEGNRKDLNFFYYQLRKDVAEGMKRRGY